MCTKTEIINRIYEDIKKYNLIEDKDTIILGASGGPDSQFLIYSLKELQKRIDFKIVLAHLNHLHRIDAERDEKLVKKTASELGFDFFIERKSMDQYAKENKLSSEDAGRRLRYEFFRKIKNQYPNSKIAVAHNKDDQAETILMRIIRGTGLDGLRAMDYRMDDIIRPILSFSKKEILTYLDKEKIDYHIDFTNLETDYTRNKLRIDIIPQIENINPSFKDSLINLSLIAKDEVSIIKDIENKSFFNICIKDTSDEIIFDKKGFESLSNGLKARILRLSIEKLKKDLKNISRDNILELLSLVDKENGKIIEKDNLVFQKSYKTYRLYLKKSKPQAKEIKYLSENDSLIFGNYRIISKVIPYDCLKKETNNVVYFDYQKITFPLLVRNRRNGDRFTAFDNGDRKKLKDFFIDRKIDRNIRDEIPLVLSDDRIIWIAPLRRSNDFKISEKTKKILMLKLEEL